MKGIFSGGNSTDEAAREAELARQKAEIIEAQRRKDREQAGLRKKKEAEMAAERDRQAEEAKNRLLGKNKGTSSDSLTLMGVGSSKDLQLITESKTLKPMGIGFESYKEWEKYKRAVLAYQKTVTARNPANKPNEVWCRTHTPLAKSPNRAQWEGRCNPDGQAKSAKSAGAGHVAAPLTVSPTTVAKPSQKSDPLGEQTVVSQGGVAPADADLSDSRSRVEPSPAATVQAD